MRPSPSSTSRNPRRNPPRKNRLPGNVSRCSGPKNRPAGNRQPLQPEKVAEAVKTAFTEPRVSTSAKMNPDPSVRGLRYGKPPKNTDAYRYVDRVPRRRADRFIWIAVIAALLAVAAIAFGLWRDAREKQAENEYIELPQAAELPSAASQPEQLK